MKSFRLIAGPVFFLAAELVAAQSAPRDISVNAPDGTALKGTYFPAPKPGPGILLFHQCNRERKTWTNLATSLAAKGFHVLAIDYRGYGESGGGPYASPQEQQQSMAEDWPGDIDAAFEFLLREPGVDRNRIGAAGASCGVNQSIQLARRHPEVKSIALLSGSTDQAGRDHLRRSDWLPVFASASDDDGDAVPLLRWILSFSHSLKNQFVQYKAAGHGTDMFKVELGLEPLIVTWFEKTLPNAPAAAPVQRTGKARKPTTVELFWDLLSQPGGAARAREFYADAKGRDPKVFLFPESAVNQLGYERLQAGAVEEAVQVFLLNVDAYPDSANVYDSLADGYVAAGKTQLAIQYSERALATLAKNPPADKQFAQAVRQSAEEKLRKLRQP